MKKYKVFTALNRSEYRAVTELRGYNRVMYNKVFDKYLELVRLYNRNIKTNELSLETEERLMLNIEKGLVTLRNMLKYQ